MVKSRFFTKAVKQCKSIVETLRFKLQPVMPQGLNSTSSPQNASELRQCVEETMWKTRAIPRFCNALICSGSCLKMCIPRRENKQKKKSHVCGYCTSVGATSTIKHSWTDKNDLWDWWRLLSMTHRDPNKPLWSRSDVREAFSESPVRQFRNDDLTCPIEALSHAHLAFFSRAFTESKELWKKYKKLTYRIVPKFKKFSLLF